MADDDGLALNFTVPSAPFVKQTNARERKMAKRRQAQEKKKAKTNSIFKLVPRKDFGTKVDAPSDGKVAEEGAIADFTKDSANGAAENGDAAKDGAVEQDAQQGVPTIKGPATKSRGLYTDAQKVAKNLDKEISAKQKKQAPRELFSTSDLSSANVHEKLIKTLEDRMSITKLTSIQQKALPPLLDGKDVFVRSETGTGKTLCYLLPIVQDLQSRRERVSRTDGTYAIVLSPTRELVLQILTVASKLVKPFIWLVPGVLMGGESKHKEKNRLRKGTTIIIATPGRLLDHLQQTECFKVSNLSWLVLDEADRLMDLGFEKDLQEILRLLNKSGRCPRQTALVSATLPKGLEALAEMSMVDPVKVGFESNESVAEAAEDGHDAAESKSAAGVAAKGDAFLLPDQLMQYYAVVPCKQRLVGLISFLSWKCKPGDCKMIVFMSSCDAVDFHFELFTKLSLSADNTNEDAPLLLPYDFYRLHGSMQQVDRTQHFLNFIKSESGILLCTDAAARGLDIPAVDWIVQYDAPTDESEYIHRVGRTARLGRRGNAVLFVFPHESGYVSRLTSHYPQMVMKGLAVDDILNNVRPLTERMEKSGGVAKALRARPDLFSLSSYLQNRIEERVGDDKMLRALAVDAFKSFTRAYCTHPKSEKDIFDVKSLHFGHVAKSFALKENPTDIKKRGTDAPKGYVSRKEKAEKAAEREKKRKRIPNQKALQMSEFGGGAMTRGPPKKKKRKN